MKRILLVDDQPHIIRVIRLSLERRGFAVETAGDGVQALEKIGAAPFDVLITDYEMPNMNGRELCETLHAEMSGDVPYTFVVTAKTNPELRDWARGLDRTEFLEKPLSLRQLSARLDAHFAERLEPTG